VAENQLEKRYDRSKLSRASVTPTPSGGARIPANLTRAGVLEYRNDDGSIRRELRLPEEVFKADSLDTLRDAPLIEGHPAMIDPSNWSALTRGHVSGTPRQDGLFVAGEIAVQDARLLTKADSGELVELSCGYTCKLDHTPGEWQGQKYDAIQRTIRYNHVGIGGPNWGRAGRDVALRLDGAYSEPADDPRTDRKEQPMKIRFDGQEYEVGSSEHVQALYAKVDALIADGAKVKAEKERLDGQLTALTADLTKAKAETVAALDPKRIDSAVAERVALVTGAAKVLGEKYVFDGKTTLEIQKAVLDVTNPETKLDGRTADFVAGMFENACASGIRADGVDAIPGAIARVTARTAADTEEKQHLDAAEKARVEQRTPRFEGNEK
jgi:uncharacterized protein